MHDTFLFGNLYDAVLKLCEENSIQRINSIRITVHTDSHINEQSLREFFAENGSTLIDKNTVIIINRKESERLTAVIEQIDGSTRSK
jgi:Zn finger protein HypA/HybF involved in hydrogenase expression